MSCSGKYRKSCIIALLALCAAHHGWSQAAPKLQPGDAISNQKPSILDQVGIDQRLNQQIPLDLAFVDDRGQPVQLQQYFGSKPVILMLVYYQCPMLCTQVLSGFTGAMNGIVRFNVGREFNVVTVSIDPRDTAQDAAAAKKRYLQRYRRPEAAQGWHFLTGKKEQIDVLAQAVGFRYAWDPEIKQYAHASGIMLLTPGGRMAQYYYGIEYAPRDIQLGLIEASKGKIGNVVDQVLLYCYHYDPRQGKYGAAIFNVLRLSALATVLVLGGFMLLMFRRDALAARNGGLTRTAN
ncbi:MAG TPA: SCO family protein [Candidatus Sulfotelmatobacter sp.]|nr:SCO family protein [Candidatus Sulfotelmatobacter sp.]